MRMTQSQLRFSNEVKDLAFMAIRDLERRRSRGKKATGVKTLSTSRQIFSWSCVLISAIILIGMARRPSADENVALSGKSQLCLGQALANLAKPGEKVRVVFMFPSSNKRYLSLAEALLKGLSERKCEIRGEYPLDAQGQEEDSYHGLISSLVISPAGWTTMIVSPGSLDYFVGKLLQSGAFEYECGLIVAGELSSRNIRGLSQRRNFTAVVPGSQEIIDEFGGICKIEILPGTGYVMLGSFSSRLRPGTGG